jgi:hypothetical protein
MNRRIVTTALFVPLLACILGADSISFDQNYPLANPGGKTGKLEGKGQHAVDPQRTFTSLVFYAQDTATQQTNQNNATRNGAAWGVTLDAAVSTHESWATLTTTKMGVPLQSHTYGLDPKDKVKVTVK